VAHRHLQPGVYRQLTLCPTQHRLCGIRVAPKWTLFEGLGDCDGDLKCNLCKLSLRTPRPANTFFPESTHRVPTVDHPVGPPQSDQKLPNRPPPRRPPKNPPFFSAPAVPRRAD